MNKLVVTIAAGLYAVAPTPSVGELAGRASHQIDTLFAADPVPYHPLEVSINGGSVSPAPARAVPQPQPTTGCQRTMTWSFRKMLSNVFTDDCAQQTATTQIGTAPASSARGS